MPKKSTSTPEPLSQSPEDATTRLVASTPRVGIAGRSTKNNRQALITDTHPAARDKTPWYKTRRGIILLIVGLVALLASAGVAYALLRPKPAKVAESPTPSPRTTPSESPKPVTKASLLTGVEMDPVKADQPVVASIIENLSPNARPQSGLSSAGVVYEALSEGGITRYLAVFQADVPTDIGPVRSLRPVFYDMAMEYGTPVAHAGGSSDGLALARSGKGFKDLDQFYNGRYFRRINTRYSPHNLYIYGPKLVELATDMGWGGPPNFTAWPRKDDAPSGSPNASVVTVNFSGADYRAVFRYDSATNSYLREVGGKPDKDAAASNKQVNPKTVILLYATTVSGTQRNGKPKTDITVTGSGKGVVFQDGTATAVTWKKAGEVDRLKLTDESGNEVKLNRGQSWVSIAPTTLPASWQ